uniref:Secreted protein n=1 Tax=Oryza barthii TaxID=65489 RepID=A0A0D3GRG2_9ORYZ
MLRRTSRTAVAVTATAVLVCSVPPLAVAPCAGWPLRLVVVGVGYPAVRRRFPDRTLGRPGSGRRADCALRHCSPAAGGRRRREKEKKEREEERWRAVMWAQGVIQTR